MAWRFSETVSPSGDFVVRKRPLFVPLLLIFMVCFGILYISGISLQSGGSTSTFLLTTITILGALAWFTIAYTQRKHDLLLLTEFQNTIFASAAGLGARFCMVVQQDGSISYIDPGFQNVFPYSEYRKIKNIEQFYSCAHLPSDAQNRISGALIEGQSERIQVELDMEDGRHISAVLSIDPLPKPAGYFVLRGREYIHRDEKPAAASGAGIRRVPGATMASGASAQDVSSGQIGNLTLDEFITNSPVAIACLSADLRVSHCNEAFRVLTDHTRQRKDGWSFTEVIPARHQEDVTRYFGGLLNGEAVDQPLELTIEGGGNSRFIALFTTLLPDDETGARQMAVYCLDLTEQKNLEERYAHSQKMQAVGQLAGGVAHDFNNLLTAMIGFCDLLLIRHPAGDQSFADIMQIKQNANRAANLVRQLLAFSRRQTLQPKMLDLTDVLAELSNLVRRLIGENIELDMVYGRDIGYVKADQGQLEQVFINLAVNARDAMAGRKGSTLTLKTGIISVRSKSDLEPNLIPPSDEDAITPGEYIRVEIADTGTGIPADKIQKIFEPFYSTKEVGAGTGLGLATVYGIIKQTGGFIYVSSVENVGTTFHIFFPRYLEDQKPQKAESITTEHEPTGDLTGVETILLVEDEAPVRSFAARALRNKGYDVLEADCGEAALEIIKEHGNELHVIVSDVIMPGMNGPEMIKRILPDYPNVKVIFISGYAEDAFSDAFGDDVEFNFLPKPFTLKQLASKIKEVTRR